MTESGLIDRDTFLQICPVLLFNGELNGCEFIEDSSYLEDWESNDCLNTVFEIFSRLLLNS